MLPKSPGANKVSVKENLPELFSLNERVEKASPHILSIKLPEKFLEFFIIRNKSDMYVWNDEKGRLVAYFALINKAGEDSMEVLSICVDPQYQRQGYGKKIMNFAENLARQLGKEKMMLVTNPKNLPALGFYKSIGYTVIKKVGNYYGDGEPRYLLEKVLGRRVVAADKN